MNQDRLAVREDLEDLHQRLVEDYELLESLCGRPGLSSRIDEALAGLRYQVAKAAQSVSQLRDDAALWDAE